MDRRVTTQDVSWFLDYYRNNQLDLNPTYQRRSVWSPRDRRFFLDTIFRGYPSPSIFLHKTINEKGKTLYYVVDGKQRLETIFGFINNKITIDKKFGDIRLDGKKWRHIQSDKDIDLRRKFWDYVLPGEFIKIDESGSYVNEVFDRLNRNSRKLVEQELRHAKYDGWLITFAENESEKKEWADLSISTTARAKRMRDVQFISELIIIIIQNNISGFEQNDIDYYYAMLEEPNDENCEFDIEETDIVKKFNTTKKYLLDVELNHNLITKYSKEFKHFYSLWACISLNLEKLLPLDDFVQKYSEFMENVNKFKIVDYEAAFKIEDANDIQLAAFLYYRNSIGANTEGPQRLARHNALMTAIFGDSLPDENN